MKSVGNKLYLALIVEYGSESVHICANYCDQLKQLMTATPKPILRAKNSHSGSLLHDISDIFSLVREWKITVVRGNVNSWDLIKGNGNSGHVRGIEFRCTRKLYLKGLKSMNRATSNLIRAWHDSTCMWLCVYPLHNQSGARTFDSSICDIFQSKICHYILILRSLIFWWFEYFEWIQKLYHGFGIMIMVSVWHRYYRSPQH